MTPPGPTAAPPQADRAAGTVARQSQHRLAEMQVPPEPDLTHDRLQNRLPTPDLPQFQVQKSRHLYFCNWRQSLYTGITSIPALDGFPVVGLAWECGADRWHPAGLRFHLREGSRLTLSPDPAR